MPFIKPDPNDHDMLITIVRDVSHIRGGMDELKTQHHKMIERLENLEREVAEKISKIEQQAITKASITTLFGMTVGASSLIAAVISWFHGGMTRG